MDPGANLETVHAGHFDVQKHNVIKFARSQLKRRFSSFCHVRLAERFLQGGTHGMAADWIVVHRQKAWRRLGRQISL
jgi:hypothetical protein